MKLDLAFLKQVFQTFGVLPIASLQGVSKIMSGGIGGQAEGDALETLTQSGYTFSFSDQGYHNDSKYADDDQAIYCLPNGIFVWICCSISSTRQ